MSRLLPVMRKTGMTASAAKPPSEQRCSQEVAVDGTQIAAAVLRQDLQQCGLVEQRIQVDPRIGRQGVDGETKAFAQPSVSIDVLDQQLVRTERGGESQ